MIKLFMFLLICIFIAGCNRSYSPEYQLKRVDQMNDEEALRAGYYQNIESVPVEQRILNNQRDAQIRSLPTGSNYQEY